VPSDRRQLNVRLDDESAARFDRLAAATAAAVGVELSQAQVIALALRALEEKYPPPVSPPPAPATRPRRTG
jgi:hypothetical protein